MGRWGEVDEKWAEILMKGQQAILEMLKKGPMEKTNQPKVTRDKGLQSAPTVS
jgi:hypothetical protein